MHKHPMKHILGAALALLLLLNCPGAAASYKLEIKPGEYNGVLGFDTLAFDKAYTAVCDTLLGQTTTRFIRYPDSNVYTTDRYERDGMSPVIVLSKDDRVVAVSTKSAFHSQQSADEIYLAGENFGKTLSALMSIPVYLDGGKDIAAVQGKIHLITNTALEVLGRMQGAIDKLDPNKTSTFKDTIPFDKWYVTYEFSWDLEAFYMTTALHAEP